MSNQNPTHSSGRPLTRRELRELAASQSAGGSGATPGSSAQPMSSADPAAWGGGRPASPPSRRSMYDTQGHGIPQVRPPHQSGAVRTLEETGRLSGLQRPSEYGQQPPAFDTPTQRSRPDDNHSAQSPTGMPQLGDFMRQAPTHGQRPDPSAADARARQAALERAQEQAAVLPQMSAPASFGALRDAAHQEFRPTDRTEASAQGLPARSRAQTPPAEQRPTPPAFPTFTTVPSAQDTQPGLPAFPEPSHNEQPQESTAPFNPFSDNDAAPANPFGSAPQPTTPPSRTPRSERNLAQPPSGNPGAALGWGAAGGAAAAAAPATPEPRTHTASPAPAAFPPLGGPAPQGDADANNLAAFPPLGGGSAEGRAPGGGTTNHPAAHDGAAPAAFPPVSGEKRANPFGLPGVGVDDDDDEDDTYELDHSYTWLQYLILVAVALVLGMIIWQVGLSGSDSAEQTEEATQVFLRWLTNPQI